MEKFFSRTQNEYMTNVVKYCMEVLQWNLNHYSIV